MTFVPLYSTFCPAGVGQQVEEVLQSGKIASGECVVAFEERLRAYLGNPLLISTAEMSSSIAMSLYLAGVRPGDEVVACPMACMATNAPIKNLFAEVRWCDCDPRTGGMDPGHLEHLLSSRTKAILLFHWAGNPADLNAIYEIAKTHGIAVIEDASEAFGAEYCGNKLGNTGADYCVFSFYPNRHLTTIEGAAVTFRRAEDFEKARWLRRYGIHSPSFRLSDGEINPQSDIPHAGWNCYMNQVSAVIGVAQLETFNARLNAWQSNGRFYDETLSNTGIVKLLGRQPNSISAYWVYTFLSTKRDRLLQYLTRNGIQASKVHLRNDIYSCFGTGKQCLPGVAEFSDHMLSIPCGWWVTEEQRTWIVELINNFG